MFSYVLSGIRYYARINIVVMLAVAVSTSVIGGALIVGDSVRYSLREMTRARLGSISDVLHSPRFFRQALADEFAAATGTKDAAGTFAPALLVTGAVEAAADDEDIRRAGSVSLLGIDESGWQLLRHGGVNPPGDREVILGYRTARELRVGQGDEVSVWVEVPSSIPRDSLLGEREDINVEIALTVAAVLSENAGASRFDLNPGQQLPYNAFLSLTTLQERLDIEEILPGRRSSVSRPAKINTILVGRAGDNPMPDLEATKRLNDALQNHLNLDDLGLRLRKNMDRGYVSAESERMIIEDTLSAAISQSAEQLGLIAAPSVVYISNEIFAADRQAPDERYSMYSVLGGIPFDAPSPLGPVKLQEGTTVTSLEANEIVLSAWLAKDLQVMEGDKIVATWHEVGSHGELPELEFEFLVRGVLAEDDPVTVDQFLTPHVEGVTDIEDFSDVDQPFPMDMDRLTDRDDEYWDLRKATPKAFVSLNAAQELWKSRYGRHTSIRVAGSSGTAPNEEQLQSIADRLAFEIPRHLNPMEAGFVFRPVLAEGLQAAVGANDFTMLFLGFSFFLILSAIILASLMFRLGIQKRINQFGLLNAVGWPARQIRQLFVMEGVVVCMAGAIAGSFGGIGFAMLMIHGLTTWWSGAVGTQFLLLHVDPLKLVIAAAVSIALAVMVIWLALRSFRSISIRDQLSGNADLSETGGAASSERRQWPGILGFGSFLAAVGLPSAVAAGLIPNGEAFGGLSWQIVCFFVAGFSSLTAGLALLNTALRRRSRQETIKGMTTGLTGLAIANAARSPMRSMLTTALIAFATFVIVAVAAGHRNPLSEIPDINSGNGGFSLLAESGQPVLFDLNSKDGQERLGFSGQNSLPPGVRIYPFSVKPGADASCVNLYQTQVPTILGASDEFIDRGGFRFADTPPEEWQLLQSEISADVVPVIPIIGDMNTLKYSLKKSIGDRIPIPNATETEYLLEIVGMLDGSVFQGVVVMSDRNLKRVDKDVAGSRYFLAETPSPELMQRTATILETALNDYGLDTEPVSEKLAGFLAVQNTYLSTFQILGGLGLIVGTFGLAAAMMRNVVERRREIALMKAIGFTTARVGRMILLENWVLLFWGILLGAASALLAMLPHLKSTGADLPWQSLAFTLGVVAVVGSLSAIFAVRSATSLTVRENLTAQ